MRHPFTKLHPLPSFTPYRATPRYRATPLTELHLLPSYTPLHAASPRARYLEVRGHTSPLRDALLGRLHRRLTPPRTAGATCHAHTPTPPRLPRPTPAPTPPRQYQPHTLCHPPRPHHPRTTAHRRCSVPRTSLTCPMTLLACRTPGARRQRAPFPLAPLTNAPPCTPCSYTALTRTPLAPLYCRLCPLAPPDCPLTGAPIQRAPRARRPRCMGACRRHRRRRRRAMGLLSARGACVSHSTADTPRPRPSRGMASRRGPPLMASSLYSLHSPNSPRPPHSRHSPHCGVLHRTTALYTTAPCSTTPRLHLPVYSLVCLLVYPYYST